MKETPIKEIESLRDSLTKSLSKINAHKSLTDLAIECRKFNDVEIRHAVLIQPYNSSGRSLSFLRGAPSFVALAALHFLNRGYQSLTTPLQGIVRTVGARDENDEQLQRTRFLDSVKAFTAKRTEVRQFLSSRFDGCKPSRYQDIDTLVAEMQSDTLATSAGIFEPVFEHSDRFSPAGIEALRECLQVEEIQTAMRRE